jgi:hypothetical protein
MKNQINYTESNEFKADLEIVQTVFIPEILKDKNVIGVLFTGSRVIGDVNSNSDYDFRVLLKDGVSRYRKGFYLNNLFAEIFCNSYIQEMSYLLDESTGNDNSALDLFMYKTGKIIYDPTHKMSEIKSKATELYDLGPAPISDKQKDWIRYDLAMNKLKLEGLDHIVSHSFFILEIEHRLVDYFFKLSGVWKVRFRDTDSKILTLDSEFHEYFSQVLSTSDTAKKIEMLIKSIEHLQNKFNLDQSVEFSVL